MKTENYKDFQLLPEKDTIINNIYAARVNKILPGINAAFVTIAQNKSCYLSLNDAKNPVYTNKNQKKKDCVRAMRYLCRS